MLMSGVQVHLPPPSQNQPLPVGFFLPLSPWPPVPLRWRGFRPWRDGRRWPRRPRIGAWGAWGGRSPVPCAAHCLFLQRTAVAQPPAMTRGFGPRSLQNMPHADDPRRTGGQGCCLPATPPPLLSAPQTVHTPWPEMLHGRWKNFGNNFIPQDTFGYDTLARGSCHRSCRIDPPADIAQGQPTRHHEWVGL